MHAGTHIDRLNASFAGRYRLEREIGAGGMATVYLATDVKHDRQVARRFGSPGSRDVGHAS